MPFSMGSFLCTVLQPILTFTLSYAYGPYPGEDPAYLTDSLPNQVLACTYVHITDETCYTVYIVNYEHN